MTNCSNKTKTNRKLTTWWKSWRRNRSWRRLRCWNTTHSLKCYKRGYSRSTLTKCSTKRQKFQKPRMRMNGSSTAISSLKIWLPICSKDFRLRSSKTRITKSSPEEASSCLNIFLKYWVAGQKRIRTQFFISFLGFRRRFTYQEEW